MTSERQKQIKRWLTNRITPFQPFDSIAFLKNPINRLFEIEMETKSEKIINQEGCIIPEIRSLQLEDINAVVRTRQNLPHWRLRGSTYFVTLCILDRKQKKLNNPTAAKIVEDAIQFNHTKQYNIDSYVIMPDHIHFLIKPYEGFYLDKILNNFKRYTATCINKLYGSKGRFWQIESFDHLVRNIGYWIRYFDYIHNNPVKAGIVRKPEEFSWSSLSRWYC